MKKTQGKVNIHRHVIGDRKPIVMFLGLGAVATLTGCDTKEYPYYAFTSMDMCEAQLPGQCEAAYKLAEKEAKRTALKYMVESECSRDFGRNICLQDDQGAWYPKMAGFITHKDENVDFTHPFFTTFNDTQSLYGKAFMANGREITDLRDMNGLNLNLGGSYAKSLPDSKLDVASISVAPTSGSSTNVTDETKGGSNGSGSSVANSLIAGYLLSEALGETGDYLSELERTKRYQQCLNSGRNDCNSYTVTSGTGRIGNVNSNAAYTTNTKPSLLSTTAKSNNPSTNYKISPIKISKSSGGFGSSGRSFGGFGG
ncbi:DUF1190 domain-containing protein [Vibrio splendidus]|uniref:DUF1190 domain-containing protein n=1 Tax=Vibrio splendidus TaxID=29497 RepID=A0ABD5AGM6_VIBSP|nr:DUF1190 domain-containing protein [Vibrio splendidus]MDP2492280.1 DUF1190 domain-containing protein [Vibrio splendidus]PMO49708.1 hypothetical protein BCT08_24025 [Vibrio splendidus]